MEFKKIIEIALQARRKFEEFEVKKIGRTWTTREIMEGYVGDVGDLMKFVMAKEGSRSYDDLDEKLQHELCDCLQCILVLSDKYGVDLEKVFVDKMGEMQLAIDQQLKT